MFDFYCSRENEADILRPLIQFFKQTESQIWFKCSLRLEKYRLGSPRHVFRLNYCFHDFDGAEFTYDPNALSSSNILAMAYGTDEIACFAGQILDLTKQK